MAKQSDTYKAMLESKERRSTLKFLRERAGWPVMTSEGPGVHVKKRQQQGMPLTGIVTANAPCTVRQFDEKNPNKFGQELVFGSFEEMVAAGWVID